MSLSQHPWPCAIRFNENECLLYLLRIRNDAPVFSDSKRADMNFFSRDPLRTSIFVHRFYSNLTIDRMWWRPVASLFFVRFVAVGMALYRNCKSSRLYGKRFKRIEMPQEIWFAQWSASLSMYFALLRDARVSTNQCQYARKQCFQFVIFKSSV